MKAANDNRVTQRSSRMAANDNLISADRLRSLLHYDPETGVFTWLVNKSNVKAGSTAGKHAANGYWRIKLDGREYPAHRLAWLYMKGTWPSGVVDHINMNKIDNRFDNLREASFAQNQHNRTEQSNNTSGYKGVSRFKNTGRWRADIMLNGKSHYLGSFDTAEDAAIAYDMAASELHGSFARNADGLLVANDNCKAEIAA